MHLLPVFSLLLVLPLAVHCEDEPCTIPSGKDACVCDTGNGIIDLTSMSYNDGYPFFSEWQSGGSDQFFYNPCNAFSTGFSDCSYGDVAVCQEYNGGGSDANCGTSITESIVQRDGGDYYVLYNGGTDGRSAEVHLICDSTADTPYFTPYGDVDQQLLYKFDLTTKCACPGTCVDSTEPPDPEDPTDPTDPNNPTDGPGGSGNGNSIAVGEIGIVVMVLFPFAFLTYFIVGGIILKYKFERMGTEIIPQKSFWLDLPFLVKDGFVFTFSPIVQLVRRDKSVPYDNI